MRAPLRPGPLADVHGPGLATEAEFIPGRAPSHGRLERSLADHLGDLARTGSRVVHLVTDPEQWLDGEIDCNRLAWVECAELGRLQLIRHRLEVSP